MHWLTVFIARQRVKHLLVEAQAELREHFHLSAVWTRWNVMHMGNGATTALTFFPQNPLYFYLFIYLCHISLQRHHTSYSTLQSVQEAEDKINHSRACQRVLAPLASKKNFSFRFCWPWPTKFCIITSWHLAAMAVPSVRVRAHLYSHALSNSSPQMAFPHSSYPC